MWIPPDAGVRLRGARATHAAPGGAVPPGQRGRVGADICDQHSDGAMGASVDGNPSACGSSRSFGGCAISSDYKLFCSSNVHVQIIRLGWKAGASQPKGPRSLVARTGMIVSDGDVVCKQENNFVATPEPTT